MYTADYADMYHMSHLVEHDPLSLILDNTIRMSPVPTVGNAIGLRLISLASVKFSACYTKTNRDMTLFTMYYYYATRYTDILLAQLPRHLSCLSAS